MSIHYHFDGLVILQRNGGKILIAMESQKLHCKSLSLSAMISSSISLHVPWFRWRFVPRWAEESGHQYGNMLDDREVPCLIMSLELAPAFKFIIVK